MADGDGSARPSATSSRPVAGGGDGEHLVCVACGTGVARETDRVAMGGATEHTFVNPGGFVYVIGTFARAMVIEHGDPSTEWSWFPGHAWCIATCVRCRVHLGWSFRSDGGVFYGLILDRLRSST